MKDATTLLGRLGLSLVFILSGFAKLGAGYAGTQGYMEAMGVPGALLPAAFLYALQRPNPGWVWPLVLCLLGNYWPPFYIDAARGDPFAWAVIVSCALAPLFGLWLLRQPLALPVPPVGRWAYLFYPGHFLVLVAIREWLG